MAPPFKEAEFDIIYGEGISKEGNILDVAVNMDIIKKSGAWFSYEGMKIGQGRDNARKYLKENPEFTKNIDALIREKMNPSHDQLVVEMTENDENNKDEFVKTDEN